MVFMARLAIYKDNYIESTAVSNCFIDEYMKDANDAQLKIYLYLLRMIHANLSFSGNPRETRRCVPIWENVGYPPFS